MSRHGGYQVRVLDLPVKVADEGLACRMGRRHLVQGSCHILPCLGVEDYDLAVDAHVLEYLLYLLVVAEVREPGEQGVLQILVAFQYVQRLLVERHTHRIGMLHLRLLRDVLHEAVHDVGLGQPVQVAHAASYQALEHEDVTVDRVGRSHAAQVGVVHPVTFFKCQVERVAIHRPGNLVLVERVVPCQPALDAPLDNGADAVERARHAVLGTLLSDIAVLLVPVEYGVHVHIFVFLLHPQLEVPDVVCCYGINTQMEAPLVQHLVAETLVAQHFVEIVEMVFAAFVRERGLLDVFPYLVREQVFVGPVAAPRVDVGMVVFLYQAFEPAAVHAPVVLFCDKVGDLLHVLVEGHLLLLRHQCHAGLVALPFRAPVVGVDGQFARCLDVHAADVPYTEIDPCLVGDVVLGGGLPDECGHFHIYVLLSVLVYHFHKPALHLIVYRAVAAERPAALHMPRHGGDKVGVGHLPVEVAHEGLACRVAGGHLVQGLLHGVVSVRVEDGHHPVYAATLQQFPYAEVVGVYLPEREQPVGIGIISFQYLQRLLVQGYPDSLRLAFLRLLRHVFQKTVLDVGPREPVKVTHAAADIAVEHEDVTDDGQLRVVVQVCVIQDVSFFGSEKERVAVDGLLAAVEHIDLIVGILHLLAPMQEGAEQVHDVDDGRTGKRSRPVVDEHAGSVEVGIFLPQQVFIYHIIPESVHLLQRDGFYEEGEVRLAQYLPAVVVVAGHLALETDDMLLCPLRAVKLLQILMETGEKIRVVPLKGANRVQHILDDLLHPPAVRLVRESFLRPLDDGGDLFRQAFLLGGSYSRRASVTEGIGIPVPVLHLKGRDHLYVHALLPDPETDV